MDFFDKPEEFIEKTSLLKRFADYVKIDTTSNDKTEAWPSSEGQFTLARKLVKELKELGLGDAKVDENCYVTATLPGNVGGGIVVGLIAHLDTSSAASGANVTPVFHEKYDGKPIKLKNGIVIAPQDNPKLKECIGDTIITSDGTTLLGADDKAGIAEIMAVLEYYQKHPKVSHPTIRVGFTPEEETGRGTSKFPINDFKADVAFTLDGTFTGEINIETFNAESAFVTITGVSTHPGTAKNKMVNALRHMAEFIKRLPPDVSPECTEDRQGFIHPVDVTGDSSSCKCHMILRDFDEKKLAAIGAKVREIAKSVGDDEPRLKVEVEIKPSYPNMYKYLKDKPEILERLKEAVKRAGIEPDLIPIRGGTDGAHLTRMGLPCPNIFTGGMNFHGESEWISTRAMGLTVCTVLNLMTLYAS